MTEKLAKSGPAAQKLRKLRTKAGLTYRGMASLLGYGDKYSTYSSYETSYKKQFLPQELVLGLEKTLVGRGDPAITREEIMSLGGLPAAPTKEAQKPSSVLLPASDETIQKGIGRRIRNVRIARMMMADVPEIAAKALEIEVPELIGYENGSLEIPLQVLIKMCGKFTVSPEYLLLQNWDRLDDFLKEHVPQEDEE